MKPTTLVSGIIISSPVFGFTPFLSDLVLTWKEPKPEILIVSPDTNPSSIAAKIVYTTEFASFLVRFNSCATCSTKLYFSIMIIPPLMLY